MLLDGYWKKDLIKFKRQLRFWSRYGGTVLRDYAGHKMNSCFLYSAAIIRKIIEDEDEAERDDKQSEIPPAPYKILHCSVPLIKYKYKVENKLFFVSSINLSDYDTKNGEETKLPLKNVCNQFIHSYVWGVVHFGKKNKLYGAMFASDSEKEKCAYMIKIEDWIKALDIVINNCHINSKESII